MDILEMKKERYAIVEAQKKMLKRAKANLRKFTTKEEIEYENYNTRFDELTQEIEREKDYLPPTVGMRTSPIYKSSNNNRNKIGVDNTMKNNGYVYDKDGSSTRDAFNRYVQLGLPAISPQEFRALSADSDTAGGYLVTPRQVASDIIAELDDAVFVRSLATKFRVPNAQSLGCPALENDIGSPTWTSELGTGDEDTEMDFQLRDLYPHPAARRILVSNKLLRAASMNPEDIVKARMLQKMAVIHEAGFLTGTGSNQPLCVFTASSLGIDTDRDISTDNTTTNVTVDGLKNAVAHLKPQYRQTAQWIMHRDVEAKIAKLKDGEGRYMLENQISKGSPNTLLGFPINISEYAPNTFTPGGYMAILGAFQYYYIADAMDIQIQRLVELYAQNNQTGYIIRAESDGMPVLSSAFVRVKLADA